MRTAGAAASSSSSAAAAAMPRAALSQPATGGVRGGLFVVGDGHGAMQWLFEVRGEDKVAEYGCMALKDTVCVDKPEPSTLEPPPPPPPPPITPMPPTPPTPTPDGEVEEGDPVDPVILLMCIHGVKWSANGEMPCERCTRERLV